MNEGHEIDLFGQAVHPVSRRKSATPSPIGSGPEGETCKSCRYRYLREGGRRDYSKCAWVNATGGPGTDIKQRWAACDRWASRWPLLEHYLKGEELRKRIGLWRVIGLPPKRPGVDRLLLSEYFGRGEQIFEGPDVENQAIAWLRAKVAMAKPTTPF